MTEQRLLSDDDVKAIVDVLEERLEERFYLNLGKGIWAVVWKALLTVLLAVAAYGAIRNGGIPTNIGGHP